LFRLIILGNYVPWKKREGPNKKTEGDWEYSKKDANEKEMKFAINKKEKGKEK